MSFVRPEARAMLWRWRDVIGGGFVLALGAYWASRSGLLEWLGYAVILAGLAWVFVGLQRVRFLRASGGRSAGVIELDERQLSYFGVGGGVIVPLGAVVRIEIETTDRGPFEDDMFWRFTLGDGTISRVPASALGYEKLFDAVSAFAGADHAKVIEAAGTTHKARFLVWQKSGASEARRLH